MHAIVSRLGHVLVAICILVFCLSAPVASQTADRPLYLNDDGLPTLAPLLDQVTPAVVNISVESEQTADLSPLC